MSPSIRATVRSVLIPGFLALAGCYSERPAPVETAGVPVEEKPASGGASSVPPGWLAGTWKGTVDAQIRQTVDGRTSNKSAQTPFSFTFDAQGRPVMDLAAGEQTTLTHVGQQKKILGGRTVSTFTVRELTYEANRCHIVLGYSSDRIQQYQGAGGGASAADSASSSGTNTIDFVREGDQLRVRFHNITERSSSLRVLNGSSISRERNETILTGVLSHQ